MNMFNSEQMVTVKGGGSERWLYTNDILWCTADNQYMTLHTKPNAESVHTKNINKILLCQGLSAWHKRFESCGFVRIHKSVVLNIRHCAAFRHNGKDGIVTLSNGEMLPVSHTYKRALLERLRGLAGLPPPATAIAGGSHKKQGVLHKKQGGSHNGACRAEGAVVHL